MMDGSLQHYASPYYDPVKAHEYYMRTRELKGRRSSNKLSDEGKKVWSYTRESIKEEKKAKVEGEKEKQKQEAEVLRERASAVRKGITERLKALGKEKASAERKRVAVELKAAIAATREAYQAAKASLDSSYEEIYQREFDKIAAEMPKVYKRKGRKKKSAS